MEILSMASFLPYYESIRARTRRVVDCIPHDRFEWRPADGRFSFGDLIRHLAAFERWVVAENAAGRPSRYPGHGRELADGPDATLAFFDAMHTDSIAILRTVSDDELRLHCTTPAGTPITRWKWLRAAIEHEVHHRGQIYLMLSLLDVATPPLFGLTSEQVRDRALPLPTEPAS